MIVSGYKDGTVRLWCPRMGDMIRDIKNLHDGSITSVALCADE